MKHTIDEMKVTREDGEDGFVRYVTHPGQLVFCDFCGEDWTERTESGGLLFQSKAVCPDCTPRSLKSIAEFHEEHLIKDRCPEGKSFADWVRDDLRAAP